MQYWVTDKENTTLVEATNEQDALQNFEQPAYAMTVERRSICCGMLDKVRRNACILTASATATADPFEYRSALGFIIQDAVSAYQQVALGLEGSEREFKILENLEKSLKELKIEHNKIFDAWFKK